MCRLSLSSKRFTFVYLEGFIILDKLFRPHHALSNQIIKGVVCDLCYLWFLLGQTLKIRLLGDFLSICVQPLKNKYRKRDIDASGLRY